MLPKASRHLSSFSGWSLEHCERLSSLYNKVLYAGFSLPKNKLNKNWSPFFEENFEVSATYDGLFTGYYAPTLKGSKTRSKKFSTPLYALPGSKTDQEMTRKEVYQGNLFNKGLELCFVENKVEAFFLEIQGSGRIELDSGEHFYVTYAGQNGHPYRALGAVFLEKGLMKKEDISMASLKRFLFENPEGTQELMEENPSFVYFQENQEGVLGTGGVFLEGEYSLAVDERILPLGSLVWVETTLYDGTPFQRLMIALDTGGAIKGAGRGDIFFGFGEKAEHLAGHQNAPGRMVVLTPQRGKK